MRWRCRSLTNLLLSDLDVERMVATVQWEIAERLLAVPGTKDYGALAVLVQSLADVELVRRLSPKVFWPRPLVDSAIVCIRPRSDKRRHVGDPLRFRAFLRDLYVHRRKNLRGRWPACPAAIGARARSMRVWPSWASRAASAPRRSMSNNISVSANDSGNYVNPRLLGKPSSPPGVYSLYIVPAFAPCRNAVPACGSTVLASKSYDDSRRAVTAPTLGISRRKRSGILFAFILCTITPSESNLSPAFSP